MTMIVLQLNSRILTTNCFLAKNKNMNMKIILIAICCCTFVLSGYTQSSDAEADAMADLLGVQKKEAIAKLVPVHGKDSVAFWKIYAEYQQMNKPNVKARIQLYQATAMAYNNLTAAVADSFATKYFINRDNQEKNLELYYKKIKAATNAITAFEFYQAEIYLLTLIRANIMKQIPTYGEVQASMKK
jgi:hypothetical protein